MRFLAFLLLSCVTFQCGIARYPMTTVLEVFTSIPKITVDVLNRLRYSFLEHSSQGFAIAKSGKEIMSFSIDEHFSKTSADQLNENVALAEFGDKMQEFACMQIMCPGDQTCEKFDLTKVFTGADIDTLTDMIMQSKSVQNLGAKNDWDITHGIVRALTFVREYQSLKSFLTDRSIPAIVSTYLDADGNGEIDYQETTLLGYIRFMMALAFQMKGMRNFIDMVEATSPDEVRDIVTGEVSCHKESMADVLDAGFEFKLSTSKVLSADDVMTVVEAARKVDAPNLVAFLQGNPAYIDHQLWKFGQFNDAYYKLLCHLKCGSSRCINIDISHYLTLGEKEDIIDGLAFPPKEAKFAIPYDRQMVYFAVQDILDQRLPGDSIENIKNLFDSNHDGHFDDNELQHVNYAAAVIAFSTFGHALNVLGEMVSVWNREQLDLILDKLTFCAITDINDPNLSPHLTWMAYDERAFGEIIYATRDLLPVDITSELIQVPGANGLFENSMTHKGKLEEFLCSNFQCNTRGHCRLKKFHEFLAEEEKTDFQARILDVEDNILEALGWPHLGLIEEIGRRFVSGIHLPIELSELNFELISSRSEVEPEVPEGKWGSSSVIGGIGSLIFGKSSSVSYFTPWDYHSAETLTHLIDANGNGVFDREEQHLTRYMGMRALQFYLEKVEGLIVDLANAQSAPDVDILISRFAICECMAGFSGLHCEECGQPSWFDAYLSLMH